MTETDNSHVLVSVCIPTFNRAEMLRVCIASVLAQTLKEFELIIVDNASEDATASVVASFKDPRINYHRNSYNIGIRNNWERCLELATGKLVTIFPDDDMMMPENLEKKSQLLLKSPSVGLVHSKYHVVNAEGEVVRFDTNWKHSQDRTKDQIENRKQLLTHDGNFINAPTVMFRRECYTRLGGFSEQLCYALDWEYWMRIAAYYDVAFLAQPLVKWRYHAGSLTANNLEHDSVKKLREDLLAKKLIARNHLPNLQEGRVWERLMWDQMAARISTLMATMSCGPEGKLRAWLLGLELCFKYPELLLSNNMLKSFLKTVLGSRLVELLKRRAGHKNQQEERCKP